MVEIGELGELLFPDAKDRQRRDNQRSTDTAFQIQRPSDGDAGDGLAGARVSSP